MVKCCCVGKSESKHILCNWIIEFLVSRVRLKIYVENTRKQLKREEPIPTWYLFNQSSFNEAWFLPDWSIELTNFLCFNPWWLGTLGIHVLGFSNVSKLYFSAIIIEEKTCILREVVATTCNFVCLVSLYWVTSSLPMKYVIVKKFAPTIIAIKLLLCWSQFTDRRFAHIEECC